MNRKGAFDPGPGLVDAADARLEVPRPHPARVYQAWLGGRDTFNADRAAAAKVARIAPWVVTAARQNCLVPGLMEAVNPGGVVSDGRAEEVPGRVA